MSYINIDPYATRTKRRDKKKKEVYVKVGKVERKQNEKKKKINR
jgi:hypothetical protein